MPPKDRPKILPERYTPAQKQKISDDLNYVSKEDAEKDFDKLQDIGCDAKNKGLSKVGNQVVNRYTQLERLNTQGNQKLSFFDLLRNKEKLASTRPSIERLLDYYGVNLKTADVKVWKRVMDIYFGSVNIFRPLIAMDIYCRYKPKSVLDMTMGWGGRLVGACALNIPKYTGIDFNKKLETPYHKLSQFLHEHSTTTIDLYFQDAVKFDYSRIKYDLVLTSPPYYNIETYSGQVIKSKDDWDRDFYIPLIEKSWKGLQKNGHYCLNIPLELYERVALRLLGKPTEKIQLVKAKRRGGGKETYHEYIYVWKKK